MQYLNASVALFNGLKQQQPINSFYFLVTLRSFIEYTRRGVWFLAWASEEKVLAVKKLTFDKPGSPGIVSMDAKINQALGLGNFRPLAKPIKEVNNEPFINCLHALTHGNPISVRMLSFGLDRIFKTDMFLLKAETDLNLFRILLYRRMLGEELDGIWKMLRPIYNQPEIVKTNMVIAAKLLKDSGIGISPEPEQT
jgi:hypothetical protein